MATKDIEVGDWEITGMEVTEGERENERELCDGILGIVVTPTAMDAIAGTSFLLSTR